jgi:DNA-binding beta-propeller fold protein YncE
MPPTPDDADAVGPEVPAELDSGPDQWVDTLDTALSRPPSLRRRLFLSVVMLVVGVVLVISIARGVVPAVRSALTTISTPILPTPTATLGIAGQTMASIQLGAVHDHTFIIASATAVWVHDGPTGIVTRIDPATNKIVAKIAIGSNDVGGEIAINQQGVWVINSSTGTISRIDPQSNRVTATIKVAPGNGFLTSSPGTLWAVNPPQNTLTKIDEQTLRVVATLSTPPLPIGLSYGAGSIWVCNREGGAAGVTRLDPRTDRIQAEIDVSEGRALWCNGDIKITAQGVWVPIFDTLSNLRQHLLATSAAADTQPALPARPASCGGSLAWH